MPGRLRLPSKSHSPRRQAGAMNRTENRYAEQLEGDRLAGKIRAWWFEAVTLRLATGVRYTPDFLVERTDGTLECHEVKGFWRDDARIKIKLAADQFPFRFVAVQLRRGEWVFEDF